MPKKTDKTEKNLKKKKLAPAKKKAAPKVAKKAAAKPVAKAAAKKAAAKAPPPAAKKPILKKAAATKAKPVAAPAVLKKAAAAKPAKAAPAPAAPVEKVAKKPAKAPEVAKPVEAEVEELDVSEEEDEGAEEVVLTDAEGRRYCRVKDCDQLATVDGYCRYHYLLYWKRIQIRKKILTEGKLERYIEELTARYPDKFLDMLRKDLRSEKEFLAAIQELEIDESATENEFEDEAQTYIDEVRGMGEPTGTREEEDF